MACHPGPVTSLRPMACHPGVRVPTQMGFVGSSFTLGMHCLFECTSKQGVQKVHACELGLFVHNCPWHFVTHFVPMSLHNRKSKVGKVNVSISLMTGEAQGDHLCV